MLVHAKNIKFFELLNFYGIMANVMVDKQKVCNIINNLLNDEAGFQNGHWSSAQDFDIMLKKHGFIPIIEIYHKYKFPDGFDEQSFEQYVMQQVYIHIFDADRIMNPEKYMQKFFRGTAVPEQEQKQYLADMEKVTGHLSDEEKEYIVNYFCAEQPKAFDRIARFLPKLKVLNPEVIKINPKTIFDFMDLYVGMTSRFHPEDIEYFCSLPPEQHEQAINNQDKIMSVLGIKPNFVMAPYRAKQLIDGIVIQKQYLSQKQSI